MSHHQVYRILEQIHMTEKTSLSSGNCAQYVFRVANYATKIDIKNAIEKLFDVKVNKVCVSRVKPKIKRFKQRLGSRSGWKKAYVVLKEGQVIDIADASI